MRKKSFVSSIPKLSCDYSRLIKNPQIIYNGGLSLDEDPADYIRVNTRVTYVI
jgi:hypothetical protein